MTTTEAIANLAFLIEQKGLKCGLFDNFQQAGVAQQSLEHLKSLIPKEESAPSSNGIKKETVNK